MPRLAACLLGMAVMMVGACSDPGAGRTAAGLSSPSAKALSKPRPLTSLALPPVPSEGLIVDVAGVATFRSLDGRQQVPMPGFRLAGGIVTGSRTWLVSNDGLTWLVDLRSRRVVRSDLGYAPTDGLSLLKGLPRVEPRGHWRFALKGPRGALLAQWSGECEVPTAYVVERGRAPRLMGPLGQHLNAHARGWTRSGLPVVEFPEAPCGEGLHDAGLYVETAPGAYRLLAHAEEGAYYRIPLPEELAG